MVKIYTLKDPFTKEIRYVGKTIRTLNDRLTSHCSKYKLDREKSHKNSWIISLMRKGKRPIIELLDEVPKKDWIFYEKYWIEQLTFWGYNLTNMSKGGEGCLTCKGSKGYKHTEEAKRKISIANSRPKSQEWIDKIAEITRKNTARAILQYDKKGNFIKKWVSFYEAAKYINVTGNRKSTIKNIHACCNNKRKTAYNFIWKYESIEVKDKEPLR